jgi:phosphatidate cytidylyltransferase
MAPLLVVVWIGGYALLAACVVLSVFAVREFYRAFETATIGADRPIKPSFKVGVAGVILLYSVVIGDSLWFIIVVVMCFAMLLMNDKRSVTDSLVTMAGLFYVVYFICFIYRTDTSFSPYFIYSISEDRSVFESALASGNVPNQFTPYIHGFKNNFVWLIVFSAFATDIFAFFIGRSIGRHKIAPKLSPKKTVEGCIGGVVGSVLVCGLFGYFAIPEFFIHCVVIGALGGVVSQFGDLTASAIKRRLGMKDYGTLIPGHGGLLDRIDSLLFTAPLVYLYLSIVSGWTLNGDMKTPVFEYLWESMNGTVDPSVFDILGRQFGM